MIPHPKKSGLNENDLMMYLAIGLKHLRLIVLLGCLSLMLGLVYYNFSKPIYYAVSIIDYEAFERPPQAPDAEKVFRDSAERVVMAALSSDNLKERTAKRLGINATAREISKRYLKNLKFRYTPERDIQVEVWAYSYPLARDWAETMVQEYLLAREERRISRTQAIIQTFSKEMAEIRSKMDEIFTSKMDYRDTNELTKIMIELNHMKEIPRRIEVLKKQIMAMDSARETLNTGNLNRVAKLSLLSSVKKNEINNLELGQVVPTEGEHQPLVVLPQIANSDDKVWQELEKQRRLLQDNYDILGQTLMPGNPKMGAIKKQLDEVDHKLQAELNFALEHFDVTYANLINEKRDLEDKLPAYNEITRRYEKYTDEFKHFDAGQVAWKKYYNDMEKRLNLVDYGNDKERAIIRYVGYGEPLSSLPISPNRMKLVLYSLLLGLALAAAVPFLIEYLDSRVSDVEQVEEMLRIRGLGVVPKITDDKSDGGFLLGDHKPDYHLQENFRVIRTNLILNAEGGTLPQVILITSAMPQEGKTVVSSNLAMSFAMKGEKTLLIDGDLRRGRLHRLFGAHNKPGVSDILRDKRPVEDAFRPTEHENLTLMTCGKHLNSASELLDSVSFVKMIEELRGKFQRIIIDTPPVLGLAETAIIQRVSDGVLFVIWSDFTPMRNAKAAIQALQGNGARFVGFVLNRLDFHALGNRYKYFYYAPNYYTNYKAIEAPAVTEATS